MMKSSIRPTAEPPRIAPFDVGDITAVYCLRAFADNPWVVERLRLIGTHYAPKPQVLVCDFGSAPAYAQSIEDICRAQGFTYLHVPDYELYSPAVAHNRAFEATKTELVFFCDIDTFGRSTMFQDLARIASSVGLRETIDLVLNLPIVHLAATDTQKFCAEMDADVRSALLDRLAVETLYREKSAENDAYVAPYSNNFLIHRHMFNMAGGYDSRFRGHGSEDFEFLLRLQFYLGHLPLPDQPTEDLYGPTRDPFYRRKDYAGFRRLFEAMAFPAETLGLRVFHLWHPRGGGEWREKNDWKRKRLNSIVAAYAGQEAQLLAVDSLSRPMKMLCVCREPSHWGYFIPLRLAGFELVPLFDDRAETIARAKEMIASGVVSAFAVFNPYMISHQGFRPLFDLARQCGARTIVIERGALPQTIYYAEDVSYASAEFSDEAFASATFSDAELSAVMNYVETLKRGDATLEAQNAYDATAVRYAALLTGSRPVIFIPMQLDDDMAVTQFVRGDQTYADLLASLPRVIAENPNALFIVKAHPLSKSGDLQPAENLIVANRGDNIHALIDAATAVITYNSGVGLIALLHGKPVITIGNAFYNYVGAGVRASTLADAVGVACGSAVPPSREMVLKLAAWFRLRKYSTFVATDVIRDFAHRKSHAYADIAVTHFRWAGHDIPLGRIRQAMPLSNKSYIWARIGMDRTAITVSAAGWGPAKRGIHFVSRITSAPFQSRRDQQRLRTDPVEFFKKAKHPWNRFFGRLLLDKTERSY